VNRVEDKDRADIEEARRSAVMLYSPQEIEAAIARMAGEAAAVVAGRDPVVLPIMLGGIFTAVRLCAYFDFPYELDRLELGRYGRSLRGGDLEWRVDPAVELGGRVVLLVDDVLDTGVTLAAVQGRLSALGVAAQYTAVLVVKEIREARERPAVDFRGVRCDDRYVFGCGMDYKGYWRGLPALYAVNGR
jgi:hypoxanthine phosphoribosyltransferase